MSVDIEIQKKIANFLPDAIEKAIAIYNQECNFGNKEISKFETQKEMDDYFSKLKSCIGQIDILIKLAAVCSKNNLLNKAQQQKFDEQIEQAHSLKLAKDDLPDHLINLLSEKDVETITTEENDHVQKNDH